MNVLSLFDGMSCGQIALERAGFKVDNYFASEIDKWAIKITQHNYPNTVQLGDVRGVTQMALPDIDLIMGGSPCQGFSFAGKLLNFDDPRSKLFFEFVRLLREVREFNPGVLFLLENVKMKKESRDVISIALGVEPIEINSALVSAQNRKRLYWTNIPDIRLPEDRGLVLDDILETASYHVDTASNLCNVVGLADDINSRDSARRIYGPGGKAPACTKAGDGGHRVAKVPDACYLTPEQVQRGLHQASAKTWKSGNKMGKMDFPNNTDKRAKTLTRVATKGGRETNHVQDTHYYRILTTLEYERLQTVPEGYTACVSNSQRYNALGNGWTVDVIAHILSFMPHEI